MPGKVSGRTDHGMPIFLKRGLAQRSLFCLAGARLTSPGQLIGKRVGLVSSTSSMAVWMRGILNDAYGLDTSSVKWLTVTGSTDSAQTLQILDEFSAERIQAWEELDGYPHALDRREAFLLALLERGALDAVVSFQAKIDDPRIRPVLHEDELWAHPLSRQIYPINHLFVVKTDVVEKFPAVAESLLSVFREARRLWTNYLPPAQRRAFDGETTKLGYDPFAYGLGEVEKKTLQTLCVYLKKEKLISDELPLNEIFISV